MSTSHLSLAKYSPLAISTESKLIHKIGLRKSPRVFIEYGVAMVSSIINSQREIEVSVQIIQAFVFMKKAMMQGNLLSPHPSWWSGIVQDIRHS